jgi:LPS export ABC transporter protein LptC
MLRQVIFPTLGILSFILIGCQKEVAERIESDKESGNQVALRNFSRMNYKENGILEWKLVARESYVYTKEDRTVLYNLHFIQFEDKKVTSELKSDWGEVNHTTKLLLLKGNIHLTTPDNKSLQTDELSYNLETEELVSDSDVSVYSSGTSIRGRGLRAKRDLNQFTILKPAAITRGGANPFKKD